MSVKPIPPGYHTVTPYLIVNNGAAALDFYKKAFGAEEIERHEMHGKIGHAEIRIGDSMVMLADEFPEMGASAPQKPGGAGVGFALYVEDCDAIYKRAIAAGGTEQRPLKDQFYGDRSGTLVDPFNHQWTISTHKEDVSPEEMKKRMEKAGKDC
jgi:PhnB protein